MARAIKFVDTPGPGVYMPKEVTRELYEATPGILHVLKVPAKVVERRTPYKEWDFDRLNADQKKEVLSLFGQKMYRQMAAVIKSAGVGPCDSCDIESYKKWVKWAIAEGKL